MARQLPEDFDHETGLRLQAVRHRLGLRAVDMADRLGVHRGYLSELENSKAAPGRKFIASLQKEFGVRREYVLAGGGPMFELSEDDDDRLEVHEVDGNSYGGALPLVNAHFVAEPGKAWKVAAVAAPVRSDNPRPGVASFSERTIGALLPASSEGVQPLILSVSAESNGSTLDYEVIPKIMGYAAAGPPGSTDMGGEPLSLDLAGEFAMSYEWLGRNLHHTTGNLATIQVHGDSMAPTLLDGDTIVIDRGVRDVQVDAIYVIKVQGARLVKRLQRRFDKSLVIISDNPAYEKETVPRGNVDEIEVIGRMVWPRVR